MERLWELLGSESQSIHARVELDPDRALNDVRSLFEELNLLELVNDQFELRSDCLL